MRIGHAHAEVQRRCLEQLDRASCLDLLDLRLDVAVGKLRTGGLDRLVGQVGVRLTQDRQFIGEVDRGGAAAEAGVAQLVVAAPWAVGQRLGGRLVRVERELHRRRRFPDRVKAKRIVFRLGGEIGHDDRDILRTGIDFLVRQRGLDRAAWPAAGRRWRLGEPHAHLAAPVMYLVLRIGVVEGRGQFLEWTELQRYLAIDALALDRIELVAEVLRTRVQIVWTRAVRYAADRRAWQGQGGPFDHFIATIRTDVAVGHLGAVVARMALLITGAGAQAPHAVLAGGAEDARQFRRDGAALHRPRQVLVGAVVHTLNADAGLGTRRIEWACRHHVDGSADPARRRIGTAGLVDLQLRHGFRGQVIERERAAVLVAQVRRWHLAAVEQHQVEVRAHAAHGDLLAFAVGAVDRHAGNALQRFGQVGVWELTDIGRDDTVDDAIGILLQGQGGLHRRTQAGHHDGDRFVARDRRVGIVHLRVGRYYGSAGAGNSQGQQTLVRLRVHRLHVMRHCVFLFLIFSVDAISVSERVAG